jgi:opacity protein-like surface antigen
MPEPLNAAEKGWYIGAGAGLSSLDPDTDGTPFSVTDDEDTGVKVFAGVDLTSSLSAFGFWADLGSAELEPQGSIDYSVYGAGLLYGFGFRRFTRLSGFVKAGISQLEIDADVPTTDGDDTQLFVGGGASWAIGRRIFVRAEYEYYSEDAQLLSLSLVKRFTFSRTPAKTFPLEDRGVERAEPL